LGLEGKEIHTSNNGYKIFNFSSWIPVYLDKEKKLSVMSIGFLLKSDNDAVIWRGII
jgi:hypothetical protein